MNLTYKFALILVCTLIYIYINTIIRQNIIVEGVQNNKIYFGQSIDMNDSAAVEYSNGIILAFDIINKEGGIFGNIIELFIYNDNNITATAIQNAKILINYDNVLGIIGSMRTPIALSIYDDVIQERTIPYIIPTTGISLPINILNNSLILARPSFQTEIDFILMHINQTNIKNICVIYQNDSYGNYCLAELMNQILVKKYLINIIKTGYHEKNDINLSYMFKNISGENYLNFNILKKDHLLQKIEAIILFSSPLQQVKIINYFKSINSNIWIYNISYMGENTFIYDKLINTSNIYINSIMKPIEKYPLLYKKIIADLESFNKYKEENYKFKYTKNFAQGYICGLFTIELLKCMNSKKINREEMIKSLYKKKFFDIYGYQIGPYLYGINNNGRNEVYMYKLDGNSYKYIY